MSYDWVRTWWDFYSAGKKLRIFLFTSGETLVGIVPLYIESLGVWPFQFRVVRLVGANIPPKVFDPPIHEAWAETLFEQILVQLFGKDGCDLLSFGPVSELHKPTEKLQAACSAQKSLVAPPRTLTSDVHTVFSLPSTPEQYYEGLSKSERRKRQYESRSLAREYSVAVDTVSAPHEAEKEYDEFVAQHTTQWQAEGKPGHFGAWPSARQYNRALIRSLAKLGRVRFLRVKANGQVVSRQYVYSFGDAYFWELPARSHGPQWDKFSLGCTGALIMIETAISEGKRLIHAGLGHYDYKTRLNAHDYAARIVRVTANRASSRARYILFEAWRRCWSVLYYKLWYRRLCPRLGQRFWQPQPTAWLRLDF